MAENVRIAIVGLGQIGGSLGLALHRSDTALEIIGHDKDPSAAAEAKKRGAVDRTSWNLISAVEAADIVVLALPLPAIRETLQAIASELKPGTVITDTASSKAAVVAWAEALLPDSVSFVGGDPLVRRPDTGTRFDAGLFAGRDYCLVPTSRTNPQAVELIANLISLVGAKPYFLDATEHDSLTVAVTHLPVLLATTLLQVTTEDVAWREMARMAGWPYHAATQLPADEPQTLVELFLRNRADLVRWADAYSAAFGKIRDLIAGGEDDALLGMLTTLLDAHALWARGMEGKMSEPLERGLDEIERFSLSGLFGFRSRRQS